MAPVAYSGPVLPASGGHQGPPQPHGLYQLAQNTHAANTNNHTNNHTQHQHQHQHVHQPQPQHAQQQQQQQQLKHRPVSKRGAMGNSVADAVVPHHVHSHGGVLHLNENEQAALGHGHPQVPPAYYSQSHGQGPHTPHGHGTHGGLAPAHMVPGVNLTARMKPRTGATLDDIARRVRAQSDRLQQKLMPAAEGIKSFAESSPVLFTFVAIFAALSFIPVLVFIGFVTAITVFSTGLATIFLAFSVAGTVMFGLTFLVPVLVITTTIAFMAVAALLGLFLAHRLYLHLADASASAEPGTTALEAVHAGVKNWWDETRSRVGLGPYKYRVAAFEDYKAFSPATSTAPELKPPRIVYEEITDYSKHHPQPTPSFQGPRTVKVERERDEQLVKKEPKDASDTGDLFAPQPQSTAAAPDSAVVKHEVDDGEWTSE